MIAPEENNAMSSKAAEGTAAAPNAAAATPAGATAATGETAASTTIANGASAASADSVNAPSTAAPTTRVQAPYRLYLREDQIPTQWYNLRADMPEPPEPMRLPNGQVATFDDIRPVFCDELVRQELDDTTAYFDRATTLADPTS